MDKVKFAVNKRGSKKVNALRREAFLPGNVYQSGAASIALEFPFQSFIKLYDQVGDTGVVYLQISEQKTSTPSMIDEVQTDHLGKVIHVVFRKVNLKEKIKAEIPVELVGEFDLAEANLVFVQDNVEVEALPTDLPEKFEIDQSLLKEIGQTVSLADLEFNHETISLVLGEDEQAEDIILMSVQEKREEEPEEEIVTEVEEPERVGEEGSEDATEKSAEKDTEKKTEKTSETDSGEKKD